MLSETSSLQLIVQFGTNVYLFLYQVVDDHMARGIVHCVDPWSDRVQGPPGWLLVSVG